MADFAALLASLQAGDAPDTIYDDLSSSYNEILQGRETDAAEHAAALEGSNSRVRELEAELSQLKALKFDELMNSTGSTDGDGDGNTDADDDGEDDDPASGGIDDLFEN